MILYKLTDNEGYSRRCQDDETLWTVGGTLEIPTISDPRICTRDVIHAYRHLDLGLVLNRIGPKLDRPVVWEADGRVVVEDWDQVGCSRLTTIRRLELPEWYANARTRRHVLVRFAVICAELVQPIWQAWYPAAKEPRQALDWAQRYLSTVDFCPTTRTGDPHAIYTFLYDLLPLTGTARYHGWSTPARHAAGAAASALAAALFAYRVRVRPDRATDWLDCLELEAARAGERAAKAAQTTTSGSGVATKLIHCPVPFGAQIERAIQDEIGAWCNKHG